MARPAHAQPAAPARASASEVLQDANEAYAQGRFDDALAAFEQAHRQRPLPRALLGIARSAESAGQESRARDAYERYLATYPNAANRRQIEGRLARLTSAGGASAASAQAQDAAPRASQRDVLLDLHGSADVTRRPLRYLPLSELLTRQRGLQHRLDTRDGLSLGAPATLLVLGLLTAGPVGGVLLAAGIGAEEKYDPYTGDPYEVSKKAFVIPGAVMVGVGTVAAITGATMIATRRGRARSIRRSLAELDFELGKRHAKATVSPTASFSSRSVGLVAAVTY